ncbi:MAG: cysteine desulfurase [Puniceicoccales bacterium]|jgi:cysteine desulfurase/selenocysteine lyase|nr:cysteine desulfurase [Puniceicoccales bacterium]
MVAFDPAASRKRFPFFSRRSECVYLDNAATTQRLGDAIDRLVEFYFSENSNVHRGAHALGEGATLAYESARHCVAAYLNARNAEEIIFTGGTTDALNTIAVGLNGEIHAGDEILITALEHHSNILPWAALAKRRDAKLNIAGLTPTGELDMEDFAQKFSQRTRIVAVAHVSNVLGTINPIKHVIELARSVGALTVIDGAQWLPSGPVDVQAINCDFYAFSAHKIFGPMGVGVLFGRREILEKLAPFRLGGGMVQKITAKKSIFRELPDRLEGGTPNVAGVVALPSVIEFLQSIDWDQYRAHERKIRSIIKKGVEEIPGLRLLGTAHEKVGIYAFTHPTVHAHDLASMLACQNICVRAGNHCAQLLLPYFQISQSLRASFSLYNTAAEASALMETLAKCVRQLS